MNKLLQNQYVRYVLLLLIGIGIGALFYPSKTIDREIETKYQSKMKMLEEEKRYIQIKYSQELNREIKSNIEFREESYAKISSLKTENTKLKQQSKEKTIRIVTPDGTIREETYKESQTEIISQVITDVKTEYNTKIASIERKYESIHKSRIKSIQEDYNKKIQEKEEIISTYKKKEVIEINKRSFGLALGVKSENKYYSGLSYDVYGPFFLDLHIESTRELDDMGTGIGIGVRW